MDAWLRVSMAVLLVFAPSVLFILLYRGLMRLQDQELIARLTEAGHLDPASIETIEGTAGRDRERDCEPEGRRAGTPGRNAGVNGRRAAFLREHGGPESRSTTAGRARNERPAGEVGPGGEIDGVQEVVRCESCGTENAAEFGLCWNCLEWVD